MWDLHADGPLEAAAGFRRVVGGAAANVALELAELGLAAAVSGVVSRDPLGSGLVDSLERGGVDVSAVLLRRGRTGVVFIDQPEQGSSRLTQRFFSYRPEIVRYPARLSLPRPWRKGPPPGSLLHFAALNPDPDELRAFCGLARRCRDAGSWITVDVNARPRAWAGRRRHRLAHSLLGCAHVVKVSADDLAVLGLGEHSASALRERLALPSATVILTRGAGSTKISGPTGELSCRPPKVKARRSIGAGDAFCAGLISALVRSGTPGDRDQQFWRSAMKEAQGHAARHVCWTQQSQSAET